MVAYNFLNTNSKLYKMLTWLGGLADSLTGDDPEVFASLLPSLLPQGRWCLLALGRGGGVPGAILAFFPLFLWV